MDKKSYCKPELKTRQLELGVFGDYSGIRGDNTRPTPGKVIEGMRLFLE